MTTLERWLHTRLCRGQRGILSAALALAALAQRRMNQAGMRFGRWVARIVPERQWNPRNGCNFTTPQKRKRVPRQVVPDYLLPPLPQSPAFAFQQTMVAATGEQLARLRQIQTEQEALTQMAYQHTMTMEQQQQLRYAQRFAATTYSPRGQYGVFDLS